MITTQRVQEIVTKFGGEAKNSGKTEVQIALLTERIADLTPHFEAHKHDFHSMTGLKKIIGQRRSLLKYLKTKSPDRYQAVITELGLRK